VSRLTPKMCAEMWQGTTIDVATADQILMTHLKQIMEQEFKSTPLLCAEGQDQHESLTPNAQNGAQRESLMPTRVMATRAQATLRTSESFHPLSGREAPEGGLVRIPSRTSHSFDAARSLKNSKLKSSITASMRSGKSRTSSRESRDASRPASSHASPRQHKRGTLLHHLGNAISENMHIVNDTIHHLTQGGGSIRSLSSLTAKRRTAAEEYEMLLPACVNFGVLEHPFCRMHDQDHLVEEDYQNNLRAQVCSFLLGGNDS